MKRSLAALGALLVVFRAATAIAGDNSESRVSIEGIGADRQSENFSAEDQTPGPPALFADVLPATGPILDATPTTAPGTRPDASATRPEETSAEAGRFPAPGSTYGLTEFIRHFAPHEPMYFVGGTQSPNVKFQFSIRYRILTPDGPLATDYPWLKGFNIGYTQRSLWDLTSPSAPVFDTS